MYDDGEHEWINLREEQDRVMIFYATEDLDGDGIIDDNDEFGLNLGFAEIQMQSHPEDTAALEDANTRKITTPWKMAMMTMKRVNGLNTSMTIRKNHIMSILELGNKV